MTDILSRAADISAKISTIRQFKNSLLSSVERHGTEKKTAKDRIAFINRSFELYQKSVEQTYSSSINDLENYLNGSLSYIFHDKQYRIKFQQDRKADKSTLEIIISKDGVEWMPLKDSSGAGIQAVVSLLLHVAYINSQLMRRSPDKQLPVMLFVDEAYHNLSADYISRFFDIIRELGQKSGFHFVLISHDLQRVAGYADRSYFIADGQVTDVQENKS